MKKQLGYTIIEIFVALAIGLVLFAGVLSIFVGMKTTSVETSTYGELQENGRFALSILSQDLQKADFWGDYAGTLSRSGFPTVPGAPANECTGEGLNNATFPAALGHFRTVWGKTATVAANMGCINDAVVGSDILQIKRVMGNAINTVANPTTLNNYYMVTNTNGGQIFTGAAVPAVDNSRVWEYQHHVYYVKSDGANNVPVLMQGRLTNSMSFDPLIDGIEMVRFMYGVDTDDDGIVNAYIPAINMTENYWDRGDNSRIIAMKIYVLARSIKPDNKYSNKNSYQLGDLTYNVNDNFRRLLFSSTVSLFNARVTSW
ncbi:PilW family protein [Thalassotalea piscium]|uniref:Type IV pilus assembly protein PilW n=1 Tax=Thalassotalea piscium TaxID=1230533 RepID=A0A7X0NEG3_9GAMM|nr:PilW family protein [Thalassotalea piscium]MBB6541910.1 type IV pilus assembly protein PilW [Thalassotalea piscium]